MATTLRHEPLVLDFGRPLTAQRRRAHIYTLIGALALLAFFALAIALHGMFAPRTEFEWPVPAAIVSVA